MLPHRKRPLTIEFIHRHPDTRTRTKRKAKYVCTALTRRGSARNRHFLRQNIKI